MTIYEKHAAEVLELQRHLKLARQYNASLRRELEGYRLRFDSLTPGWYVAHPEGWEGPYETEKVAMEWATKYANTSDTLVVEVVHREPQHFEEPDFGVRPGVDFPATLCGRAYPGVA